MIIFIWLLNFVISWVNAWGCGKSWNESKHSGGFAHLVNWSAAIMSASGFTWCYTILLGGLATQLETKPPHPHPYLSQAAFEAMLSLGYLIVILPILGSGLVITVAVWRQAYRERSFGSGAVASYDTFAQIYNIGHALHDVPQAFGVVSGFFGSKDEDDNAMGKLVIVLVALAVCGGILTTYTILTVTARNVARDKAMAGCPSLS